MNIINDNNERKKEKQSIPRSVGQDSDKIRSYRSHRTERWSLSIENEPESMQLNDRLWKQFRKQERERADPDTSSIFLDFISPATEGWEPTRRKSILFLTGKNKDHKTRESRKGEKWRLMAKESALQNPNRRSTKELQTSRKSNKKQHKNKQMNPRLGKSTELKQRRTTDSPQQKQKRRGL